MKRLVVAIGYLSVLCLLASCVSHNTCSSKDRIEMKQGGFSSDEINGHCTSYQISDEFVKTAAQVVQSELAKQHQNGNQSAAPASQNSYQQNHNSVSATTCATPYGQCPLMQPGTSGAPCVCHTMYGQIPGVMHSQPHNYVTVKVFYGTDRKAIITQQGVDSYGGERGSLDLGMCEVSIPRDHRLGSLESPSIWKFEYRPDPAKHITVLSVSRTLPRNFRTVLNETITRSIRPSAFIFIHGYNMNFEDAVRRTAQIAYDLNFEGIPILYSWPSNGSTLDYVADGEQARRAAGYLRAFIEFLLAQTGLEEVHFIAHSMGNRVLTAALQSLSLQTPSTVNRLGQIALVAPDIDAEIFSTEIVPRIVGFGRRLSLYASAHDRALILSKSLQHYPRAGDLSEVVTIIDGMDTIDATAVDTSLTGHSYYAENRSVISDLFQLLRNNASPSERFGMQLMYTSGRRYWRFAP